MIVKHSQNILTKPLTKKQKAELEALKNLPDDKIDFTDISEFKFSDKTVVGQFYRPIKKAISVRVDLDVLTWLKQFGHGYQSRINDILRREMTQRSGERS